LLANLSAPKSFHVCILGQNDYIAVTDLRSCTGLALYDTASNVGAMYHFGGQMGDAETTKLNDFVEQLTAQHVPLGRFHMWLFGSNKCEFANVLVSALITHGFNQRPIVLEAQVQDNSAVAFYLLGTGVVTNCLT
jgi:hypothetical protein